MKVLKFSYYLIMTALIMWFLLSWWEIGTHNMIHGYTYNPLNLFLLF